MVRRAPEPIKMETDAVCWVCSTAFAKGERVTRLPSLGIEVHARCADSVLRGDPWPPARQEWEKEQEEDDSVA